MEEQTALEPESNTLFDPNRPLARGGSKLLIAVSLLVAVIFYYVARYSSGRQLEMAFGIIKQHPLYLLGMLLAEGVYLFLQGNFFQRIYQAVGLQRQLRYLIGLYISMNLVNTVTPVAGLSGSIYMTYLEHKNGMQRSESVIINFLYYLTDYIVFLLVLFVSLMYLLIRGQVDHTILLFSLIFLVFVLGVGLLGVSLLTHPTALHRFIHWVNNTFTWLTRRNRRWIKSSSITRFVREAQMVWQETQHSTGAVVLASLFAAGLHISCLFLLWCAFQTLQIPASLPILLAGYSIATLLNIISITPGGVGVAEGGMTAVFHSFGIPVGQALLVTLLYRIFFIWFPLALGLATIHFLPQLASRQLQSEV